MKTHKEKESELTDYAKHLADEERRVINQEQDQQLKSTRVLALEWWDNLNYNAKKRIFYSYGKITQSDSSLDPVLFADEEDIEYLYLKETKKYNLFNQKVITAHEASKSNQKQFVQFDADKFKAYISKFKGKDKAEMTFILLNEVYKQLLLDTCNPYNETDFSIELKSVIRDLIQTIKVAE